MFFRLWLLLIDSQVSEFQNERKITSFTQMVRKKQNNIFFLLNALFELSFDFYLFQHIYQG